MSFSFFPATTLLAVLLLTPPMASAQATTDQQITTMLQARKLGSIEITQLMKRLSEGQKDQLLREQAIIDGILLVSTDPSSLSPDDRQRLWNATKVIDSIIAQDRSVADEQLVCRQERRIGSQLAKRNCRTRAQLEREREDARRALDNQQNQSRR
ncbi:MAG: hypothetical protein JNM58_04250 [Xanthomonadaceae bacterium]|nr:hypothetical protein [Xanthomonadaceae bacterium]